MNSEKNKYIRPIESQASMSFYIETVILILALTSIKNRFKYSHDHITYDSRYDTI